MTTHRCRIIFFALILLSLFVSACAPRRTYSPDPDPSARKVGQKPYTVNGKRYEPLASHKGYVEDGIASSYGREFHGRKTSNGELFDMHAMTAAHKTLPLGVYVKVQLKRTGREIVVRINDRGPFVRERIIDLSEGAARRLDMIQEGIAAVRVTALGYRVEKKDGEVEYKAPASYDNGRFALQVAALKNRTNAHRYADELKRRYGAASVQEATIGGDTYYRIRIGNYTSLQAAQAAQESFERKGFPGNFVVAAD